MYSFKQFLIEDASTASKIADTIYSFTSGLLYGSDRVQCHQAVEKVKTEGKELQVGQYRFWKELEFIEWDETKWGDFSKHSESDTTWKRIKNDEFQDLVRDISDGSVNGHSYIKLWNYYIDPYFNSCGLSFKEIQKCCKWFTKTYKEMGIIS